MSRYADAGRCPDCAAPLTYDAAACASCSLPLRGPVAHELYLTLAHADQLVAALRATTQPATPQPRPVRARRLTALSGASVPQVLLALGALCLLVAALVFLAVTWSVMGVGGRTATLICFTLVAGALTGWLAGRDLRGATEALGLVTLGLCSFDLLGAAQAGWLGELSTAAFSALLGSLLVAAGLGAAAALDRTPARGFTGGEVVAALGSAVM